MAGADGEEDAYVQFSGVEKTYDGETLVVKGLSLAVRRGEFLTLLGPSGSGKTTTLMMLAGFETPTRGSIYLDGRPIDKLPPHRRNIGVVFQNYALFPHMTVEENVAFPLVARKMPRGEIQEKVRKILGMVQLAPLSSRRPGQISGGQQQRVALARALVFEPQLVLMDEPLGALDKQLRERMQLEIKRIHEQLAVTVVYVTHDQSEALTMSNRIAVFNDGKIQQLATPEDIYERPQNRFVAQFIGENNQLQGQVVGIGNGGCQVKISAGHIVQAVPVSVERVGDATILSLRPERVKINPVNGSCTNAFPAVVEELTYLGDHTRARVRMCGQPDFVIKVPNAQEAQPLRPGSSIKVGWAREDCRALDAPAPRTVQH